MERLALLAALDCRPLMVFFSPHGEFLEGVKVSLGLVQARGVGASISPKQAVSSEDQPLLKDTP